MQIRGTYDRDAAAGTRMLDDLIVYLRASLSDTQDSGLTVASELRRVQAYLGMVAPQLRLSVCADSLAFAASIPAMLILPLAECAVPPAGACVGGLQIAASVTGGMLRVMISSECEGSDAHRSNDALRAIRRRLHDLYADRAHLTTAPQMETERGLVLLIPYEPS